MNDRNKETHTFHPICGEWGHFLAGDRVSFSGKHARVITAPPDTVPQGCVPIAFDKESPYETILRVKTVPIDDITRVYPT